MILFFIFRATVLFIVAFAAFFWAVKRRAHDSKVIKLLQLQRGGEKSDNPTEQPQATGTQQPAPEQERKQ